MEEKLEYWSGVKIQGESIGDGPEAQKQCYS